MFGSFWSQMNLAPKHPQKHHLLPPNWWLYFPGPLETPNHLDPWRPFMVISGHATWFVITLGRQVCDGLICDCLVVVCWSPCCWLGKKTQQTFWKKPSRSEKMRAFFHGILSQARKLERVKHRVCPNHTFTQILAYLTPVLSEKNTSTSTKFPLWSLFFFFVLFVLGRCSLVVSFFHLSIYWLLCFCILLSLPPFSVENQSLPQLLCPPQVR